jgi:hypothetical protein
MVRHRVWWVPLKDNLKTVAYIPQRRIPGISHVERCNTPQRLLITAYLRMSCEIVSQRPIIHRPHQTQKVIPFGVQSPSPTSKMTELNRPPRDRFQHKTLTTAGACLAMLSLRLKVRQVWIIDILEKDAMISIVMMSTKTRRKSYEEWGQAPTRVWSAS